ncbi:energy transducer TonB [Sphingomonas lenta]|uniref:Energy transducer TonB n=1 Tax=Sphingomonas lenta TaxID=1141887 RepID=A0A2A2SD41_9SPHN|nr:energy transducer TonB [Sphingomonas lenta]PAX07177.1 energy transducer TonB [Sphingomonas lenta]
MPSQPRPTRDRLASAALSAAVTAAFGYALILGLNVDLASRTDDALKTFNLLPDPPPPPRETPRPLPARTREKQGEAAPPALRARPKEIVAPEPIVTPPPPPVLAAPIADTGPAPSSGATDKPGPGTGAGGEGIGRGAGGSGDGTGGAPVARRFRHVSGEVTDDDQPEWMREAGMTGVVVFSFTVGPYGRVTRCAVTESSGHPALDQLTCRLFMRRTRFRPSVDATGRAVADDGTGEVGWGMED